MIDNKIYPSMNIFSRMNASMPIDEFSQKGFGISSLKESQGIGFKFKSWGRKARSIVNSTNDG